MVIVQAWQQEPSVGLDDKFIRLRRQRADRHDPPVPNPHIRHRAAEQLGRTDQQRIGLCQAASSNMRRTSRRSSFPISL